MIVFMMKMFNEKKINLEFDASLFLIEQKESKDWVFLNLAM